MEFNGGITVKTQKNCKDGIGGWVWLQSRSGPCEKERNMLSLWDSNHACSIPFTCWIKVYVRKVPCSSTGLCTWFRSVSSQQSLLKNHFLVNPITCIFIRHRERMVSIIFAARENSLTLFVCGCPESREMAGY